MRRVVPLLAMVAIGLVLGSGVALSAPTPSPDAQAYRAFQPKIIGGTAVPNGKYWYLAALLDKRKIGGPLRQQFCGGTLIDKDSVLTAAHCFAGDAVNSPGRYRVLLGRARLNDGSRGVFRDVKRVFRHPLFDFPNHDAAVLKLSRPVRGIPKLKLAPPSSANRLEQPRTAATVAGWGAVSNDPTYPTRMQELVVPIVRDAYARSVWPSAVGLPFFPKNMVAAGLSVGKNSCFGDSGGPLIKKVKRNGKKVTYQIGIVSGGSDPCAREGVPAGYAEVNSKEIAPFIHRAARK